MEKKSLKNGSYSILITLIVIAAAVVLNVIIKTLPENLTQLDFSTNKLYTLSDTTTEFLAGITDDVEIYYICENGEEDDTTLKLLHRYADASSHVYMEQIDPALYPGFTSQYTDEAVKNGSIIVACGETSKVIDGDGLYTDTYNSSTGKLVHAAYDGEGQVTSAIDYVTNKNVPVLYVLNGNGEGTLDEAFLEAIAKNNIEVKNLNLLSEDVPEDAAGLLINAPQNDYSPDQAEKIINYLEGGGSALITSNYSIYSMPNFDSILSNYGLVRKEGVLFEGDSGHFMSYPYCLIPNMEYTRITEKLYNSGFVLMPMCQAIEQTDTYRNSISMYPLLQSTNSSYNKADVVHMTTSVKENGDEDGPFTIGMLVEEDTNTDDEVDTRIVYYSTGYLLDADYNTSVSGSNAELVASTVNYLCNNAAVSSAVPVKNLQVQYLTMSSFSANFWTVVTVFVLPLLFIVIGFVIWMKRRKG